MIQKNVDPFPRFSHAILDTNVLTQLAKEKRSEAYRPIFEFLIENDHSIFLLDASKFELVGFAGSKKNHDYLANWIDQFTIISVKPDDVETATLLSSYYKLLDPQLNSKQISYCDCLYAAQLIKYKEGAFLITANIQDFPVSIFDIKEIEVIEDDRKATIVAFITYNESKWLTAKEKFDRSD